MYFQNGLSLLELIQIRVILYVTEVAEKSMCRSGTQPEPIQGRGGFLK